MKAQKSINWIQRLGLFSLILILMISLAGESQSLAAATMQEPQGSTIYLPLILNNFPFTPAAPVLNAISNADGDGSYTVSWTSSEGADTYTLQEDDNAAFSSPTTAYEGSGTSKGISGKYIGTYYYRVKASNAYASSGWSNVQSVVVTVPLPQCLQYDFSALLDSYYLVYTDGRSWNFTSEDYLPVTRVETRSSLASRLPVTFTISVKINGDTVASWIETINDTIFKAYDNSADVSFNIEPGDTITYYIKSNITHFPYAGIHDGSVKLCK